MCGVGRFVRIEALHARYSAASQSKWKDAPVIVGYGDGDDGVAYVTYEFRCSKPPHLAAPPCIGSNASYAEQSV